MKELNFKKGFTLIELLVVIAIIGILASIVLASLSNARSKGKDASIRVQLSRVRSQAELYYNTNGNYGANIAGTVDYSCTAGTNTGGPMFNSASPTGTLTLMKGVAQSLNGTQSLATTEAVCNYIPTANPGTVTAWAIASKGATSGQFYCVDSLGTSRAYNATSTPSATALTGASGTGVTGVGAVVAGGTTCN